MAFLQLHNARGKNTEKLQPQNQTIKQKNPKLYLFYKPTKDSFLHLIKISILCVWTNYPPLLCKINTFMLSSSLLPWTPWCRPTHFTFTCWSTDPDCHLLIQPKGYSRCGREEKVANWNKWHQNPKASDKMRWSRHISHMLLNNKQMEATTDTSELNQNYLKTSNSNWLWKSPCKFGIQRVHVAENYLISDTLPK